MSNRSTKRRRIKVICEEEEMDKLRHQPNSKVVTRWKGENIKRETKCIVPGCSTTHNNVGSSTIKRPKTTKEAKQRTSFVEPTTFITKTELSLEGNHLTGQNSEYAQNKYKNSHPSTSSRHFSNNLEQSSADDMQFLVTTKLSPQSSIMEEVVVTAFPQANQTKVPDASSVENTVNNETQVTTLVAQIADVTPPPPEPSTCPHLESLRKGVVESQTKDSRFEQYSDLVTEFLQQKIRQEEKSFHLYQIEAVLKTKQIISEDKESGRPVEPVLIIAPTGSGKSGMIVLLPYVLASKKVLIITPSIVISEQISKAFGENMTENCFFEEIGLLDKYNDDKREVFLDRLLETVHLIRNSHQIKKRLRGVVVVNAQKFSGTSSQRLTYESDNINTNIHESFFEKFDTLIVDEAHHYPAETWVKIIDNFLKWRIPGVSKKIIFLTATPYRNFCGKNIFILGKDGQKRIAYHITKEMIKGVTIRPCVFEEPNHNFDFENVEYLYDDLTRLLDKNAKKEPRFEPQAMILVRLTEEATNVAKKLNLISGQPKFAVAIRPKSPELEQFTNGEFRVAVTCGVALEGYDNPKVTVCVILKNIVKGRILFDQFVGRCMRLKRGLDGSEPDQSVGTVLSYPNFGQRKLWEYMERAVAEDDPDPTENDDGFYC